MPKQAVHCVTGLDGEDQACLAAKLSRWAFLFDRREEARHLMCRLKRLEACNACGGESSRKSCCETGTMSCESPDEWEGIKAWLQKSWPEQYDKLHTQSIFVSSTMRNRCRTFEF